MSDHIDSIIRNTARYHFEDGINEILFFLVRGDLTLSGFLRFRKYLGESSPATETDNDG